MARPLMGSEKKKRVNIALTPEVHEEIKKLLSEDKSLSSFIEDYLKSEIEKAS